MALRPQDTWQFLGSVQLRRTYRVERRADVYRVSKTTPRQAEFAQAIDGCLVRHLANALQGRTVVVEDAERELEQSKLKLPYHYGYKLRFLAQDALVALIASGQASQRKVGNRFEYDLA